MPLSDNGTIDPDGVRTSWRFGVIPILVEDADPIQPEALHEIRSLRGLPKTQALRLRTTDWDNGFCGILDVLERRGLLAAAVPGAPLPAPAEGDDGNPA